MMKRLSSLAPLGLAILLASCASPSAASSSPTPSAASEQSSASEPSGTPAGVGLLRSPAELSHNYDYRETLSEEYRQFKNKMSAFSATLSESLAKHEQKEGENIAFSPLSIELCLGLAVRGADGNTRQELLDAMGVDFPTLDRNYKLYFNQAWRESYNESKQLIARNLLTNSIWIDDEADLQDEGLDALRDDYYCYSFGADFNGRNAEANQAIKEFIYENTNGLLNPNLNLSPKTLFVLMNTLYLKDIWRNDGSDLSFADNSYQFKNQDGTISPKQLLRGLYRDGKATEGEEYSSFYAKTANGLTMTFLKPNPGKSALEIFTKENIQKACDPEGYLFQDDVKKEIYHTSCVFPEFSAECDINLTPIFRNDFHVNDLFTYGSCDMGNLSNDDVYCSAFRQIAKLEVDKKGIEGAAVTYMEMAGASAPNEEYTDVYEEFVLDESFGFVLSYRDINLFSGIVTNIDK